MEAPATENTHFIHICMVSEGVERCYRQGRKRRSDWHGSTVTVSDTCFPRSPHRLHQPKWKRGHVSPYPAISSPDQWAEIKALWMLVDNLMITRDRAQFSLQSEHLSASQTARESWTQGQTCCHNQIFSASLPLHRSC